MNTIGLKNSLFTSAILDKYTKFDSYQLEDPQMVLLQQEQEQTESGIFANVLLNFSVLLQRISKEESKIWIGNPRIFLENISRNVSYYQNLLPTIVTDGKSAEINVVFQNRQIQNLQKNFYQVMKNLSLVNQATRQISFEAVNQEVQLLSRIYRQERSLSVQENHIESPVIFNKNPRFFSSYIREQKVFQDSAYGSLDPKILSYRQDKSFSPKKKFPKISYEMFSVRKQLPEFLTQQEQRTFQNVSFNREKRFDSGKAWKNVQESILLKQQLQNVYHPETQRTQTIWDTQSILLKPLIQEQNVQHHNRWETNFMFLRQNQREMDNPFLQNFYFASYPSQIQKAVRNWNIVSQAILASKTLSFQFDQFSVRNTEFLKVLLGISNINKEEYKFPLKQEQVTLRNWIQFKEQNVFQLEKNWVFTPDVFNFGNNLLNHRETRQNSLQNDLPNQKIQRFYPPINIEQRMWNTLLFPPVSYGNSEIEQDTNDVGKWTIHNTIWQNRNLLNDKAKSRFVWKPFREHHLVFLQNNSFSENWQLMEQSLYPAVYRHRWEQYRQLFNGETHISQRLIRELPVLLDRFRDRVPDNGTHQEPVIFHFYGQENFGSQIFPQTRPSTSFSKAWIRKEHTKQILSYEMLKSKQNQVFRGLHQFLWISEKGKNVSPGVENFGLFSKMAKLEKRLANPLTVEEANVRPDANLLDLSIQQVFQSTKQTIFGGDWEQRRFPFAGAGEKSYFGIPQTNGKTNWVVDTQNQTASRKDFGETIHREILSQIFGVEHPTFQTHMDIAFQARKLDDLQNQKTIFPSLSVREQALGRIQNYSSQTRQILLRLYQMRPVEKSGRSQEFLKNADCLPNMENVPQQVFSIWNQNLVQHFSNQEKALSVQLALHKTLKQSNQENFYTRKTQNVSNLFSSANRMVPEGSHIPNSSSRKEVQPTEKVPVSFQSDSFHMPMVSSVFREMSRRQENTVWSRKNMSLLDHRILTRSSYFQENMPQKSPVFSRFNRENENVPPQLRGNTRMLYSENRTEQNRGGSSKIPAPFEKPSVIQNHSHLTQVSAVHQNLSSSPIREQKTEVFHFLQAMADSVKGVPMGGQVTAKNRASVNPEATTVQTPVSHLAEQTEAVRILQKSSETGNQEPNFPQEKAKSVENTSQISRPAAKSQWAVPAVQSKGGLAHTQAQAGLILLKNSVFQTKDQVNNFLVQLKNSGVSHVSPILEQVLGREEFLQTVRMSQKEPISQRGNPSVTSYGFPLSLYERNGAWGNAEYRTFHHYETHNSLTQAWKQPLTSISVLQGNGMRPFSSKTASLSGQRKMPDMVPASVSFDSARQLVNRQKSAAPPQQQFPVAEAQTQLRYLKKAQREQEANLEQQTGTLKKLERQLKEQEEQITKLLRRQSIPEQAVPDSRQMVDLVMREIQKQMRLERQRRGG